jgi:hypothetical protein
MRTFLICTNVCVGKTKGKWSLARPTNRWKSNTEIISKDVVFEDVDCNHLDQIRNL